MELGGLAGTDYRLVADMAACMAKEGVGFYARQGWNGGDGVWEWDSRTSTSRGSKGRLQMEEEEFKRRSRCKRQMDGAEGEGGVRGWVEDEEEVERRQQQRQLWRRSQVQQEEAALEGVEGAACAGEPAGGETPQEEVQAVEVHDEWEEWVGSWGGMQRRWLRREVGLSLMGGRGITISHPVSATIVI